MKLPPQIESKIAYEPMTGCWLWTGYLTPSGYGKVNFKRKSQRAHRLVYELVNGPIPSGLVVGHHCDTPSCVNPTHLFVGSQKENLQDCARKGRIKGQGMQRLSAIDVRGIREDTRTQDEIGRYYGISQSAVSAIKTGKSYAWVL